MVKKEQTKKKIPYYKISKSYKKDKAKCGFCKKEIKGNKVAGMLGDKIVCLNCGLELADIVWHNLNLKIVSDICNKLDKKYHGGLNHGK